MAQFSLPDFKDPDVTYVRSTHITVGMVGEYLPTDTYVEYCTYTAHTTSRTSRLIKTITLDFIEGCTLTYTDWHNSRLKRTITLDSELGLEPDQKRSLKTL